LKNICINNITLFILGGKLKAATKHRKQDNHGGDNQVDYLFLFLELKKKN